MQAFWNFIRDILEAIFMRPAHTEDPAEQPVNQPPPTNLVNAMCLAIQKHEGWYIGSRSQRNNNPGNCRHSFVGYLPIYEPVGRDDQNFAIFKDYQTGFLYLRNLIRAKASKNPGYTLYQFFSEYAPDSDGNNSRQYAEIVAKALNVAPTWKIRGLL